MVKSNAWKGKTAAIGRLLNSPKIGSHSSENVHIESSHKGEKGSHKNSESSRKEQPKGSYRQ